VRKRAISHSFAQLMTRIVCVVCVRQTPLNTTTMTTPARRRLMRDFRRLQQDPPQGVTGAPLEDDIMRWNAVIFGYAHFLPRARSPSLPFPLPFSPALYAIVPLTLRSL
jgi:hypothetical protein